MIDELPIGASLDRSLTAPSFAAEDARRELAALEAWRASDKKREARLAEEKRAGLAHWHRHLEAVYARRSEEHAVAAIYYEGRPTQSEAKSSAEAGTA